MPPKIVHPDTPESSLCVKAAIDAALDQQLFRALSDPTRLKVLSCLVKCGRACSVSEVSQCCAVDFSVVNKHMKVLEASGILSSEKRGRTVWYEAQCGALCDRLVSIVDAIAEWCPNMDRSRARRSGTSCCG